MAPPSHGIPVEDLVLRSVHSESRHRNIEGKGCHRVQLALRSRGIGLFVFKGSPASRQPAFAARHQARYPAGYPERPRGERPRRPGFPSPFGHRHSLLGHPVPAQGFSSPHGRLTDVLQHEAGHPGPDGVSTFRTRKTRLGLGALCIPGTTVSTRSSLCPRPPPTASQRQCPCPPSPTSRPGRFESRDISESFRSVTPCPAFPSPVAPGR